MSQWSLLSLLLITYSRVPLISFTPFNFLKDRAEVAVGVMSFTGTLYLLSWQINFYSFHATILLISDSIALSWLSGVEGEMKLYSCNCNLFIVVWHGGQKEVFSCSSINKYWFNHLFGWVIVLSSCCNTPWLFWRTIRGVYSVGVLNWDTLNADNVNILVPILFLQRCGIHNHNSWLIN